MEIVIHVLFYLPVLLFAVAACYNVAFGDEAADRLTGRIIGKFRKVKLIICSHFEHIYTNILLYVIGG